MLLFLVGKRDPETILDDDIRFLRIRCPRCEWKPTKHDRWQCDPGCGHVWNTFDTHGRCPACDKQWTATSCHRCHAWSPHDDWYESSAR